MGNYVFLDFEFTCSDDKYSHSEREVLSMAAVFTDTRGNYKDKFYSVVKPSKFKTLSPRCTELTGIEQSQADKAPYFSEVYKNFMILMDIYRVSKIFVWGTADKVVMEKSLRYSKSKCVKGRYKSFINFQNTFMLEVMKGKIKSDISLEDAAHICGVEFSHNFYAPSDALCLSKVYFALKKGKISRKRVRRYMKYYEALNYINYYKGKQNRLSTLISNNKVIKIKLEDKNCSEKEGLRKKLSSNMRICDNLSRYIKDNEKMYQNMLDFINNEKSGH